jgi:hypothetical protein
MNAVFFCFFSKYAVTDHNGTEATIAACVLEILGSNYDLGIGYPVLCLVEYEAQIYACYNLLYAIGIFLGFVPIHLFRIQTTGITL